MFGQNIRRERCSSEACTTKTLICCFVYRQNLARQPLIGYSLHTMMGRYEGSSFDSIQESRIETPPDSKPRNSALVLKPGDAWRGLPKTP
jgi:hypothetical protein